LKYTAPAIVIGLDGPTGLQTARVLAARGVPVIGYATDGRHPCARTRACSKVIVAETRGSALIESLQALGGGATFGEAVLFPCTDGAVATLSRHRGSLPECYQFVLPPAGILDTLIDKARFAAWAETAGLPVPRTYVLQGAVDIERAAHEMTYPAVLKPAFKTRRWKTYAAAKVFRVDSMAELLLQAELCMRWADTLVVQEWVPGDDSCHYTCNCYIAKNGEPVGVFTSRKLRQWPRAGGEGCLSEPCDNPAVAALSMDLFRLAGHTGLGYVEIKHNATTGQYLIIEPNVGRPTGRSAQADASGVELLFAQYCDALGLQLPLPGRMQRSLKWIHIRRDLQAAWHLWRRGELTVLSWMRSIQGPKVHALFSWTDPVPFWADIVRVIADAFGVSADEASKSADAQAQLIGAAAPLAPEPRGNAP
jgi:D-aspartate ligase